MSSGTGSERRAERFLRMIRASQRGRFKIYIGMAAGVGKTYRMLEEAHELLENGLDLCIGFVETYGREDTIRLTEGLPVIPMKTIFYKGHEFKEMDLEGILKRRPQVVLVDELAHTNVPGSKNEKRWQDVIEILDAGINVISTMNIQHIESINPEVEKIAGVEIKERVPDSVVLMADDVVNVDLAVDELLERLRAGKIYDKSKIPTALSNFFQEEKLLSLRDLAIKEVLRQVERKIEKEVVYPERLKINALLTCISTNRKTAPYLIRKASRLAALYNSKWYVLYVQTPKEAAESVNAADQRHLINNFKLANELGAEVVKLTGENVAETIVSFAKEKEVGLIIIGRPRLSLFNRFFKSNLFKDLLKYTEESDLDIFIVAIHAKT
ncbi:MAG TPA: universal stress protein [Thermodesulfobacteriota bacterium]|nr:universal stress protein [Thermodesulfobacteriota bacterium]